MGDFKQAGEAFDVLSYWDIADWEHFISNGRNCFCLTRHSSEFVQRKDNEEKGMLLSSAFPPSSEV